MAKDRIQSFVSSIQQVIARRNDIEQQITALKDELHALKIIATEITVSHARAAEDTDTAMSILAYAYFMHDKEVFATPLKEEAFEQTGSKTIAAYISIPCAKCEKPHRKEFRSRSDFQWHLEHPTKCSDCKEQEYEQLIQEEEQYVKERQQILYALRTMPYKDYLKTEHWATVRRRALKRANFKCQLCNATKQLHVHHRTYERRGMEAHNDVIALCADCHKTFHDERELEQ